MGAYLLNFRDGQHIQGDDARRLHGGLFVATAREGRS